jgi:hypothetical protein
VGLLDDVDAGRFQSDIACACMGGDR